MSHSIGRERATTECRFKGNVLIMTEVRGMLVTDHIRSTRAWMRLIVSVSILSLRTASWWAYRTGDELLLEPGRSARSQSAGRVFIEYKQGVVYLHQ